MVVIVINSQTTCNSVKIFNQNILHSYSTFYSRQIQKSRIQNYIYDTNSFLLNYVEKRKYYYGL